MSTQSPGQHPSDDELVELASDALDPARTQPVIDHVRECTRCADRLASAERDVQAVRRLLRADDPGPMPHDVWARLENAITAEVSALHAGSGQGKDQPGDTVIILPRGLPPITQADAETGTQTDTSDTSDTSHTDGVAVTDPEATRVLSPAVSVLDAPPREIVHPDDDVADDGADGGAASRGPRLRRPSASSHRTRRQVRTEDRDEQRSRLPVILAVAASTVLVLLGGAWIVNNSLSSSNSSTAGSVASGDLAANSKASAAGSAGAMAFAPGAQPAGETALEASGTNYTKAQIAAQAKGLLRRAELSSVAGVAAGTVASDTPSPSKGVPQADVTQKPLALPSGQNTALVTDPSALKACLKALDASDLTPVAVDLARWEGREAAIIILRARAGGYEFWAVERTCSPADSGALFFTTIAAP